MKNLDQCPCCDYFTLPPGQDYEICPVCFWEADHIGIEELDLPSGANHGLTLREARANFLSCGACSPAMVKNVLPPAELNRYKHVARVVGSNKSFKADA